MNYQDELSKARAELASAQERLAKLDAQAKEDAAKAAKPWEPNGGDYILTGMGGVSCPHTTNISEREHELTRRNGGCYPTQEAAQSALPYVTFFKRLCCLAAELNPSGKVGGDYYIHCADNGVWKAQETFHGRWGVLIVFETEEAAQKAADILNKDSWAVPGA